MTEEADEKHVTRRELSMELRSFRNEVRVLIVAGVLVLRFDVPKEVTAAAVVVVFAKSVWTASVGWFWSH